MDNIQEFRAYHQLNEDSVPLYNLKDFIKNPKNKPEKKLKDSEAFSEMTRLVREMKSGKISEISISAEVKTQGKNVSPYIADVVKKDKAEAEKLRKKKDGSRTEKSDKPDDHVEYGGEGKNLFIDSEFIVQDVVSDSGVDYIKAIPESCIKKAKVSPEKMKYYTVLIEPKQVIEIFYKLA